MSKSSKAQRRIDRAAAQERARVEAELAARKGRRRRAVLVVGVLVVVIAVASWVVLRGSGRSAHEPSAHPQAHASGAALVVGNNPDAPVRITIYEDFLCPFCHELEEGSRDMLRRAALDGRVVIVYRPFQLLDDHYSRRALDAWLTVLQHGTGAQALRYHDVIYDHQPYEVDPSKPGTKDLRSWAKDAEVPPSARDAIGGREQSSYSAAQQAARDADVRGTPWVLVNGKRIPGSTIAQITSGLKKAVQGRASRS